MVILPLALFADVPPDLRARLLFALLGVLLLGLGLLFFVICSSRWLRQRLRSRAATGSRATIRSRSSQLEDRWYARPLSAQEWGTSSCSTEAPPDGPRG